MYALMPRPAKAFLTASLDVIASFPIGRWWQYRRQWAPGGRCLRLLLEPGVDFHQRQPGSGRAHGWRHTPPNNIALV